jgi:3-deoxy-D-manno-octulosonate 8-phosphate phosphatase KdsC-like HAD superfamily phosphatase
MQLLGIATDIDGTLTDSENLPSEMIAAIKEARRLRPELVLIAVTGRSYDCFDPKHPDTDPVRVLGEVEPLFDAIVCDDGGTIRFPRGSRVYPRGRTVPVGTPIPGELVEELRRSGVDPLWNGITMVSSVTEGNDPKIRSALRRLHVPVRRQLNKQWVMYVTNRPDGRPVNKAVGLRAACDILGISPKQLVGTGDGENDISFMRICGLSVAMANAKPELKASAKLVSAERSWRGTRQVLGWLVGADLAAPSAPQHGLAA